MKKFFLKGTCAQINYGEYVITGNTSLSVDTEEESVVLTINQEELPKDEVYLSPDAKYQIPRRLLREIKQSLFTISGDGSHPLQPCGGNRQPSHHGTVFYVLESLFRNGKSQYFFRHIAIGTWFRKEGVSHGKEQGSGKLHIGDTQAEAASDG